MSDRALIGVVHLLPLPGGPVASPGLTTVMERAIADARALAAGGVDGIIVENLGDAPFCRDQVEPFTIAAMALAVAAVADAAPGARIGVNVLRNDARSALAIAAATGAAFIRVNVHIGAMVTDQGIIEGRARDTLIDRRRLGADGVEIVADVMVKHAVPLGSPSLASLARDTWHRGRADVLVVSGSGTGQKTDPEALREGRAAVPDARWWLGSGLTPDNASDYLDADGAIVGTWLHADADLTQPIDARRVEQVRRAFR